MVSPVPVRYFSGAECAPLVARGYLIFLKGFGDNLRNCTLSFKFKMDKRLYVSFSVSNFIDMQGGFFVSL